MRIQIDPKTDTTNILELSLEECATLASALYQAASTYSTTSNRETANDLYLRIRQAIQEGEVIE